MKNKRIIGVKISPYCWQNTIRQKRCAVRTGLLLQLSRKFYLNMEAVIGLNAKHPVFTGDST
jgi:hypothetical protein